MNGIEELKDVLRLALKLGEGACKALEDGKVTISDISYFVEVVPVVVPAMSGLSKLKDEVMDLDDAERAELKAMIDDEFDIPQDSLEAIIETALKVAIDLSALVKAFKK